ncbi:MAG TPA: hypothetical protein PKJ19_16505, partial [Flavobacteriales bacterium]|nr:hypothetical protein [Flavobacteriales bacterium]
PRRPVPLTLMTWSPTFSHLKSIEAGDYNVKSGLIYNDLFSSCEKVGDHVINVSEALAGEV